MVSIHIVAYKKPQHLINCVASILQTVKQHSFEILVLECGNDPAGQEVFREWLPAQPVIRYITDQGNLGLAAGLNYLSTVQHPSTRYIVELNDDMFFGPQALDTLVQALQTDPQLGVACCQLVNGELYDRLTPRVEDVQDFAKRYPGAAEPGIAYGGSNMPWLMSRTFYEQLRQVDVWVPALPGNRFPGIWDEGIDPMLTGWCADWDIHNRITACGRSVAVVDGIAAYHYDHCSCSELDAAQPGWQQVAVENYIAKYGPLADMRVYGMSSKGLPVVKRPYGQLSVGSRP